MRRSVFQEIGRTQRLSILDLLKKSTHGLDVRDLAEALAMSYMGVKAHCLDMHRQGYLETWRQPGRRGRPRMLYRLTMKTNELFSEEKNDLALSLLQASRQLFGPTAPQKLLMLHFRSLTAKYREAIAVETTEERARSFAAIRDREGHLSYVEGASDWKLIESHDPLQSLRKTYPEIDALECQMMSQVIGVPLQRHVHEIAGLYRAVIKPL
jgi:predicted ArsR family transcriptional regulator